MFRWNILDAEKLLHQKNLMAWGRGLKLHFVFCHLIFSPPAQVAPKTAGEIVADTVLEILEERGMLCGNT
jgi:hypothetical protein